MCSAFWFARARTTSAGGPAGQRSYRCIRLAGFCRARRRGETGAGQFCAFAIGEVAGGVGGLALAGFHRFRWRAAALFTARATLAALAISRLRKTVAEASMPAASANNNVEVRAFMWIPSGND